MTQQITKFDIPADVTEIVIFAHGFGVRWDSRGMFTDIQKSLPKEWGSVLFDFYKINGDHVTVTAIEQQVQRLQEVVEHTKKKVPDAKIHIIAHSKGCIITALAQPEITGEIILLAPPEQFGTKLEKYFQRYPGATEENKELIIPRKDGTTTHIPLPFFKETQAVDAEEAMAQLAAKRPIHLLQTTKDEVIGETNYQRLQAIQTTSITKMPADHNFTGKHRTKLLEYIRTVLKF